MNNGILLLLSKGHLLQYILFIAGTSNSEYHTFSTLNNLYCFAYNFNTSGKFISYFETHTWFIILDATSVTIEDHSLLTADPVTFSLWVGAHLKPIKNSRCIIRINTFNENFWLQQFCRVDIRILTLQILYLTCRPGLGFDFVTCRQEQPRKTSLNIRKLFCHFLIISTYRCHGWIGSTRD